MTLQRTFSALALALLTVNAEACATCASGDNLQLIEASNSVLWILLGLVGFIFLATGATVLYLWRKANAADQPSLQLIPNLHPADAED